MRLQRLQFQKLAWNLFAGIRMEVQKIDCYGLKTYAFGDLQAYLILDSVIPNLGDSLLLAQAKQISFN